MCSEYDNEARSTRKSRIQGEVVVPRKEIIGCYISELLVIVVLHTGKGHLGERLYQQASRQKRAFSLTRSEVLELAILVIATTSDLEGADRLVRINSVGVGE